MARCACPGRIGGASRRDVILRPFGERSVIVEKITGRGFREDVSGLLRVLGSKDNNDLETDDVLFLIWAIGPIASVAFALVAGQTGVFPENMVTEKLLPTLVFVFGAAAILGLIMSVVAIAKGQGRLVIGLIGVACNGFIVGTLLLASGAIP